MNKIFIAIATCRRNKLLAKTLISLDGVAPLESASFEVCVGDNDPMGGAAQTIKFLQKKIGYDLFYAHCPEPGIPQVRNELLRRALASDSTALVFIDDDEIVDPLWLKSLWDYFFSHRGRVHAVHGPVLPLFPEEPSGWLPAGLYSRDLNLETGTKLNLAATGNVLIDLNFLRRANIFFSEQMALTGGSDTEFFFRFTKSGGIIHWCNAARVYEHVSKDRMSIRWLFRRSFRCGCSDIKFWSLNHSFLYTLFWGIRRSGWNFVKNIFYLLSIGKPRHHYVKHLVLLVKTFGLLAGIFGYSYFEYSERHC